MSLLAAPLLALSVASTVVGQNQNYSYSFTTSLGTIGTGPSALTNQLVIGSGNPIAVGLAGGIGTFVVTNPSDTTQSLTIRLTPSMSADGAYAGTTDASSQTKAPGTLPLVPAVENNGVNPSSNTPLPHVFTTAFSEYTIGGVDLAFSNPTGFKFTTPLNIDYAFILNTTINNLTHDKSATRNIGFGGILTLQQDPNTFTKFSESLSLASSTASYNPLFRGTGFNVSALISQDGGIAGFLPNLVDSADVTSYTAGLNGGFGAKGYLRSYIGVGTDVGAPGSDPYNSAAQQDASVPNFQGTAVPEPASILLFATGGVIVLACAARRRARLA